MNGMPVTKATKSLSDVLGLEEGSSSKFIVDLLGGTGEDQISGLVAPLATRGSIARKVGQVAPKSRAEIFSMLKNIPGRLLKGKQLGRAVPTLDHYIESGKATNANQLLELLNTRVGIQEGNVGGIADLKRNLAAVAGDTSEIPTSRQVFHELGHLITKEQIDTATDVMLKIPKESIMELNKKILGTQGGMVFNSKEMLGEGFSQYAHQLAGKDNVFEAFPPEIQDIIKGLF